MTACVSVPFFCGVGVYGVRERAVFFGVGVCFAAKCGGVSWVLLTAGGSGRRAVLSEKRVKKRAFVRFRATLRGGAYNLSQKKSNLCGMRLQADVNVL